MNNNVGDTDEENSKNIIFREAIKYLLLVILAIIVLSPIAKIDNMFFHTMIMTLGIVVCFCILLFAMATYEIAKDDFFMVLGVGYGVVGILDMLHLSAHLNIGVFGLNPSNLAEILWIVSRYFGGATVLIASILLYKGIKDANIKLIIFIYSGVLVLSLIEIYGLRRFPVCYIDGTGYTLFGKISRYVVILIYFISLVVIHKSKNYSNKKLVTFIEAYIILRIINEILFTLYIDPNSIEHITAFILRVLAFYMLYKAVLKVGLREPYRKVCSALVQANNELELENNQKKFFEEAMIKSDECYKLLIEDSNDAILIANEKKHLFANYTAAKLFGLNNAEELVGMEIESFLPKEDIAHARREVIKVLESKKGGEHKNIKIVTAQGNYVDVQIKSAYIIFQAEPCIMFVFRDLSTEKRFEKLSSDMEEKGRKLEETLELNRLITEHFANVSHELRTPLNVILGATQILDFYRTEASVVDCKKKVESYHKSIKQNCYRLLRLVNNLIDLSKIDSGFFELNKSNGDIVKVVEDVTLSIVSYCENKGVNIIFDTDIEEKYMAFDNDKIERIMLNLLSNSIKFTKEGDDILVFLEDRDEYVDIIVKDTGAGIPSDKLDIIFERYRQAEGPLCKENQGTGIGLSLVKSLVELHGGSIAVSSKFGEGTEFRITLPAFLSEGEINKPVTYDNQSNVERISIEFSDIYSTIN
ncbi:MASE3 domain-containing sensor histidine kinase [Clostridium manihotivorum]|uniref:histidine kinase n=1 Tax=Clostridium manihotivorum TaxID=2320868 RepID=A0A410DSM0_9CLOT|nr:MASE3 domain-containing protein [Clostridium manihotivorum]QAA32104.1 PAS domain-containing sensor histidine kinase [Clostridium manihotivorum]